MMLATLLAVGGCAGAGSPGTPSGGAPVSGAAGPGSSEAATGNRQEAPAALAQAVAQLQKDTYRYTTNIGDQSTMIGLVDPKSNNFEIVGESPKGTTTIRKVDGVTYLKIASKQPTGQPGTDGKKWRKIDKSSELGQLTAFDATQTAKSLEVASEVQWVDDDTVKGLIDPAKVAQQWSAGTAPAGSQQPVPTVPFEADIDSKGRLAEYRLTMPATASQSVGGSGLKYSDFGTPADIQAPPTADILPS